jgi:hypothetical protein
MNVNQCSKTQAANLIRSAMSKGFKREVDPVRLYPDKPPMFVQVNLSKHERHWMNSISIIFSRSRKSKRVSVSVSSRRISGTEKELKQHRGLWHANYLLNNP